MGTKFRRRCFQDTSLKGLFLPNNITHAPHALMDKVCFNIFARKTSQNTKIV